MTSISPDLEQARSLLSGVCQTGEMQGRLDGVSVADLVQVLLTVGRVQRLVDAVVTTVTGEVLDRDCRLSADQVSRNVGCVDATELLRRTLRVDAGTARRYVTASRAVRRPWNLSAGEPLPARYEALGDAFRDGELSVSGLLAATRPLDAAGSRISATDRATADRVLADTARGLDLADDTGMGGVGPAPTTDELAALAQHIVLLLDPDGKESDDDRANRRRGLTLGRARDGIVPIRGGLLPDVAGQLQRLLDSLLNPRIHEDSSGSGDGVDPEGFAPGDGTPGDGAPGGGAPGDGSAGEGDSERGGPGERGHEGRDRPGVRFTTDDDDDVAGSGDSSDPFDPDELPEPVDPRSPAQKRHDAFASILTTAAGTGGGSPPSVAPHPLWSFR